MRTPQSVLFNVISCLFFLLPLTAFSAPLESVLKVFQVKTYIDEAGQSEMLVPADSAEPGAILEYVLSYKNTSDSFLRALVATDDLPPDTSYLANSATTDVDSRLEVSIDAGETWEKEPVIRKVRDAQGEVMEVVISPSKYTDVRWVTAGTLKPKQTWVFRYRVRVD